MNLRSVMTAPLVLTGEKRVQDRRQEKGRRPWDARGRRVMDAWLDRWISAAADLTRLKESHPMLDAVIDEQRGRQIRIGERWLTDWASCNYLGFDLDEEIIAAIPEYLAKWGTHPSWSRLLGSPRLYVDIEDQLIELLGCEDVLLLPTITQIHMSVIPILAGQGTIFLDGRAHKTIYDGAMVAAGRGATVVRFHSNDAEHLEELMRAAVPGTTRLIAMDGVNSMTGNAPDLAAFSRIARDYGALLYVDDAHGFGVIGERSPDELCPYGARGNSLFRHQNVPYDNAVLIGACSKAYSSLLAFIALPTRLKNTLKVLAPPYLYSGPSPVASLASVLVGLQVNRKRGDSYRVDVWKRTARILEALHELDIRTPNESGFPIIEIPLANHEEIDAAGMYLFERGVYVTLAAYPLVPKNEVGVRVQVTAANTDDEVGHLIKVLTELRERFSLQRASEAPLSLATTRAAPTMVVVPTGTVFARRMGDVALWTNSQVLARATDLSAGGAYAEALSLLDKTLDKGSADDPQLHAARGWMLENLGPARLTQARQAYETAIALDSGQLWVHVGLANVLGRLDDAKAAAHIYKNAVEQIAVRVTQEPELLELFGRCQYRLGRLNEAIGTFQRALAVNETWTSVYFDFGLALLARGLGDEATRQYEAGLAKLGQSAPDQRLGPVLVATADLYEALQGVPAMSTSAAASNIRAQLVRIANEIWGATG